MNVLFLTSNYSLFNMEQRLLQKIEYFNIYNYIKELSYLGFEYSFLYPLVLTVKNTKNYFYTLPVLRINEQTKYRYNIREYSTEYNIKRPNLIPTNYFLYTHLSKSHSLLNPLSTALHILHSTKAKAKWSQIYQLIGIRGYLSGIGDHNFKLPVLNNFSKGLNLYEYFISCLGARKGVVDTAIKTADAGYLTKRLVELVQEIVIKQKYCGTKNSCSFIRYIDLKGDSITPHYLLIYGKTLKSNILNLKTKEVIVLKNRYICPLVFNIICTQKHSVCKVKSNSVKLCALKRALCSECLGATSLTTNFVASNIGMLVGQTVGEPSTQMTLRTFHTGGIRTLSSQVSVKNRTHIN